MYLCGTYIKGSLTNRVSLLLTSIYGGVGDVSFESVGGGVEGKTQVVKEVEEEEEEGGRDSVLLFDEQTDSFQLYNEEQHKVGVD